MLVLDGDNDVRPPSCFPDLAREREWSLVLKIRCRLMCTGLQEEEWSADVNAFIQEEDDESYIYNIRSSVNDLLGVRMSFRLSVQN